MNNFLEKNIKYFLHKKSCVPPLIKLTNNEDKTILFCGY